MMLTISRSSFLLPALVMCAAAAAPGCAADNVNRYHTHPIADTAKGVYLETGFDEHEWYKVWGLDHDPKNCEVVASDPVHGFVPLHGKALRITIEQGSHLGTDDLRFHFAKSRDQQPEEMYFRYSLRLGSDFQPVASGKLPGFDGTYGKAGWGERKPDGTDGWSARGYFEPPDSHGRFVIGSYIYHMDQTRDRGDAFPWSGTIQTNRWYTIEQYIKLNTPDKPDGVIRAWVDGKPVFEKHDIRFRKTRELRIEDVWMNIYHGAAPVAAHDYHLYIDDVVISQQRAGVEKK